MIRHPRRSPLFPPPPLFLSPPLPPRPPRRGHAPHGIGQRVGDHGPASAAGVRAVLPGGPRPLPRSGGHRSGARDREAPRGGPRRGEKRGGSWWGKRENPVVGAGIKKKK